MDAKVITKPLTRRVKSMSDLIHATGHTHEELANLSGVSRPTITNLNNGRFTRVSHGVFRALASALEVSDTVLENALNASKEAHESEK